MTKLFAFGCSFVSGDQDDFGPNDINYNPNYPPTHNMSYNERDEYLKYNVSFAAKLAKHYNLDFDNQSQRGDSNFRQLDKIIDLAKQQQIRPNDLVIFGFTSFTRDRSSIIYKECSDKLKLIGHKLTKDRYHFEDIEQHDQYIVSATLKALAESYNFKLIVVNAFDNALFEEGNAVLELKGNFPFHIGRTQKHNTLTDVLNNTWHAARGEKHVFHTEMEVPADAEKLWTWNKHPSELGHEKIKDWLVNYIDEHNIL